MTAPGAPAVRLHLIPIAPPSTVWPFVRRICRIPFDIHRRQAHPVAGDGLEDQLGVLGARSRGKPRPRRNGAPLRCARRPRRRSSMDVATPRDAELGGRAATTMSAKRPEPGRPGARLILRRREQTDDRRGELSVRPLRPLGGQLLAEDVRAPNLDGHRLNAGRKASAEPAPQRQGRN